MLPLFSLASHLMAEDLEEMVQFLTTTSVSGRPLQGMGGADIGDKWEAFGWDGDGALAYVRGH